MVTTWTREVGEHVVLAGCLRDIREVDGAAHRSNPPMRRDKASPQLSANRRLTTQPVHHQRATERPIRQSSPPDDKRP